VIKEKKTQKQKQVSRKIMGRKLPTENYKDSD
jgi:hypothetical protein